MRRQRPPRRVAARDPGPARHRVDLHRRCGRALQGPRLRRHRPDRLHRPRGAARLLHPADAQPRALRPPGRDRHAAGVREGRRAGRAARPRGLHPQPGQGGGPRRYRPARVRRARRRGRGRLDPGVPALPEVGLRLRPGDPDRDDRGQGRLGGHGLAAPADREGRPRHRREPGHRRADRPRAAPRRRHGGGGRRTPGRERAAGPDEGAGRRPPHAGHHREGRAAADRPPPQREARRGRRGRPQRRHHPRQEARQHAGGPLGLGDRGEPHRSRADHPGAARRSASSTTTAG